MEPTDAVPPDGPDLMEQLQAMSREELLPELKPHLITVAELPMIHHPLVVELALLPGAINRRYLQKKEQLETETCPEAIIWLHERPYRLLTLQEMWEEDRISHEELKRLLPRVWTDGEGASDEEQDSAWITEMFHDIGFHSDNGWAAPAQPMPVWRAGLPCGMSWTLDPQVARYFSDRFGRRRRPIYSAVAPPRAVLAVFMDARGESEVVVDPSLLTEITLVRPAAGGQATKERRATA